MPDLRWLLLVTMVGCKAPVTPDDPGPANTGDDDGSTNDTTVTDTAPPTGTTPTDTAEDTGVPWTTDVDCTALLPTPVAYTKYDWVPGSEDFTFDAEGYMIQVTGGGLKRTPYGGPSELLVPLDADVRGTRILPDGRVVLATSQNGTLLAVDPVTGSQEPLASGLTNPNGVAIGVDGRIYVATTGRIMRVDPVGGDVEVVADLPGNSFDGLTFSPDFTRLYFDEEFGQIHYVDFDAAGNPGTPRLGATIPLGGLGFSILDGMAMDACGNLYVAEMNGTVWRVRVDDGSVEEVVSLPGASIIPALNFGFPPVGGWNATSLYVITFTGSVYELDIGVPGKWEPHLP
jgi:sugar lactone lactonase YvrE